MPSGVGSRSADRVPPLLRLLRPHQYAKNLLVFAAPGAAGRLDEGAVVAQTVLAFVLFCAVSSTGYVLNDLLDVEADRLHPLKRTRPIASGAVSETQARALLLGLGIPAIAAGFVLGWPFAITLGVYAAISFVYSARLKRIPWLELLAVSAGFVVRAVGGGTATDTAISGWFLLVVSCGALLVITGKRVGELLALGADSASRAVLGGYRLIRLQRLASIAAGVAVAGYATWAASVADNRAPDSDGAALLRLTTVPFAVAIGRYLVLSWNGAGETPESLIARDRAMQIAGACWILMYSLGLYL